MEEMLTKGVFDQNSSIQRKKLISKNISRKATIKSLLVSDLTIQWEKVILKF